MKRVIRLTESDLTRIVKRVIKEQQVAGTPQSGSIAPLSSNELILGNNQKLTLYPTWNNAGTSPLSVWMYNGKYNVLPNKSADTNNVVITITNNDIKGLVVRGTYTCDTGKMTYNSILFPEGGNLMYRLDNGADIINNQQYPSLVQTHFNKLINGRGLSATSGPVSQLIAQYCK